MLRAHALAVLRGRDRVLGLCRATYVSPPISVNVGALHVKRRRHNVWERLWQGCDLASRTRECADMRRHVHNFGPFATRFDADNAFS